MSNKEQIHSIYENVKYKINKGYFYLMDNRVTWKPKDKTYFTVSLFYDDISFKQINRKKNMIKLVMNDNKAFVFDFNSASEIKIID